MNTSKYSKNYFPAPGKNLKWTEKESITVAPQWCSVDLRDGNQSLIVPMTLEEKVDFFNMLLKIGFKEIEIGFPAACDTEYEFLRYIIEKKMIPSDVSIQVLTQCREHIIRKTFEALDGAPNATIHFYNSLSLAQREQVFHKSKDEIKKLAVDGAKLIKKLTKEEYKGNYRYEYTPESFTGTEPEFALEVCNAVLEVLEPSATNNVIINLPVTMELSLPHVFASQVEYIGNNLYKREFVTLSVHPHNDRGTGVADTELALLAGADRVEGTLFGNGERTGNVDIVTLALNMYSHGIDPKLDFSDLPTISSIYEKCTGMKIYERTPYAGALVFAAFSGGHQDAIAKSINYRQTHNADKWNVPYIPIDPADISRKYDGDVIRVNSMSGKGGIGFILERHYGYSLPANMREDFGYYCKGVSDREHRELKIEDILALFKERYFRLEDPIKLMDIHYEKSDNEVKAVMYLESDGKQTMFTASGNGSLDAFSNAIKEYRGIKYKLVTYTEHSLNTEGSGSIAASYIGIQAENNDVYWGVGTDTDIIRAGINALLSAVNNMLILNK